jgi:Aspartyl protease
MPPIKCFAATTFALMCSVLHAAPRCLGNVASLPLRLVQSSLIVVPVEINRSGPYDFVVDTGSQITVVDPKLASELNLKIEGRVGLIEVASFAQASIAELDTIKAGSYAVDKPFVVVQDLGQIQAADPRIRGILGENFLAHFDLLIDYPHQALCLDQTKVMEQKVRGEHIPLVRPNHPESELPFTERLVISVRLSDTGLRQILLQLDSGSDGPILYASIRATAPWLANRATLRGGNASQAQRAFALLPPQDMKVGTRTLTRVPFVTPVTATPSLPNREEDGLLPTVLFRRVFISFADHYIVFDPR